MEEIFKMNMIVLATIDQKLYEKIMSIKTNDRFSVDQVSDLLGDYQIRDSLSQKLLYDASPAAEIHSFYLSMKEYENYPLLYLFGLGNGTLIPMLLQNNRHKRIVVYETYLEIIYIALHLNDFSFYLSNRRLKLVFTEDYSFAKAFDLFRDDGSRRFCKTYDLMVTLPYYDDCQDTIQHVNMLNMQAIHQVVRSLGNDPTDTLIGIRQHMMYIFDMITTPKTKELFANAANSNLAVIVATGPSLTKQLPLLKEYADRITIISVDASLPILEKNGIKPDIVVSMERVHLTGQFFKKTPADFQDGIIFALSSLQHPDVIESIKPEYRQISMRPFNFMKYFELHDWGYIGVGMSSANMAYELAYMAGFKQVALIGQDLAYAESGLSHASSHVFGEDEIKFKESDILVEAYGGGRQIKTTPIWNSFRQTFESHIHETAQSMQTFNATEGGARIHGATELPFKQVLDRFATREKERIVLTRLSIVEQETLAEKIFSKTVELLDYIQARQDEVKELFLMVMQIVEAEPSTLDINVLKETSNAINLFRENLLDDQFNLVFKDLQQSTIDVMELDLAMLLVQQRNNSEEEVRWQINWIKSHRQWLFTFAGLMENYRHAILTGLAYSGNLKSVIARGVKVQDIDAMYKQIQEIYGKNCKPVEENQEEDYLSVLIGQLSGAMVFPVFEAFLQPAIQKLYTQYQDKTLELESTFLRELLEIIRIKLYDFLSQGVIPNRDYIHLWFLYRRVRLESNPKISELIGSLEKEYMSMHADKAEKFIFAHLITLLRILNGDGEKGLEWFFGEHLFFDGPTYSAMDAEAKQLKSFVVQQEIPFELVANGISDALDTDHFFSISIHERMRPFTWMMGFFWGLGDYENHPLWVAKIYPKLLKMFYRCIEQDLIDEVMQLHFWMSHIFTNRIQEQKECTLFNEEVEKPASEYYKVWAQKHRLRPCGFAHKHEKRRIALVKDRIVKNSPLMVEYSLLSNLSNNSAFTEKYELTVYTMSTVEKSLDNQNWIAKIQSLGFHVDQTATAALDLNCSWQSHLKRALVLRETLITDQIDIMIIAGNNLPVGNFLFSTRTAEEQIFWSHGNFQYDVNGIDKRISHFNRESSYEFKQFQVKILEEFHRPDEEKYKKLAEKIRKKWPENVLILGSIGRLVKIDNDEYISTISEILKHNPDTLYLACGTGSLESIKERLLRFEIPEDRFFFEGFVDPHVYGYVIDVYLNTFPEPSGESLNEFLSKGDNKYAVSLQG